MLPSLGRPWDCSNSLPPGRVREGVSWSGGGASVSWITWLLFVEHPLCLKLKNGRVTDTPDSDSQDHSHLKVGIWQCGAVVRNRNSDVRGSWVQIIASLFIRCLALDKPLNVCALDS